MKFHTMDLPNHIVEAAQRISEFMKTQGVTTWELMDICSRNHAEELRKLRGEVRELTIKVKNIRRNLRCS